MAKRNPRYHREPGYCKHGVYTGGCGIDWMCGRCEDGDDPHPRDEYIVAPQHVSVTVTLPDGEREFFYRGRKEIATARLLVKMARKFGWAHTIERSAWTHNGWVSMGPAKPLTDAERDRMRAEALFRRRYHGAERQRRREMAALAA